MLRSNELHSTHHFYKEEHTLRDTWCCITLHGRKELAWWAHGRMFQGEQGALFVMRTLLLFK